MGWVRTGVVPGLDDGQPLDGEPTAGPPVAGWVSRLMTRKAVAMAVSLVVAAGGGFAALALTPASASAPSRAGDPRVSAGSGECTTGEEGYCQIGHTLGEVPVSVVVTLTRPMTGRDQLPYQLATDQYTATAFRLRALTNNGSVYSGPITVSYVAAAGDLSRLPPSTPMPTAPDSTPPPTTTPGPTSSSVAPVPPVPTNPAPAGFWLSGGSVDTNSLAQAVKWGNFRGRPVTFATVYPTRDAGWDEFVRSHATSGQPAAHNDKTMTLLIQTPPFEVSGNYAALVAGSYDRYWQQIGSLLKTREDQGFPPAIVSVGWEMNGTYMYWGGKGGTAAKPFDSPAQFIAGYRRVVSQLRVTYPNVQTAWVFNAHATPASIGATDAFQLYPGDDVVTYLGTDDYDHYPTAPTKAAFDSRANAKDGMYWLANLARAHGKQLVVPEWGASKAGSGGGDNPVYIQCMWDTFQAWHAEGLLKGEFYFADPVGGGNVDSDLMGGQLPNARDKYISLW